jgi:hypothetical protein
VTQGIIDPHLLHAPGEVTVVGIAGDEIPVHKRQGSDLAPIPSGAGWPIRLAARPSIVRWKPTRPRQRPPTDDSSSTSWRVAKS